jgi:hypothetical protein
MRIRTCKLIENRAPTDVRLTILIGALCMVENHPERFDREQLDSVRKTYKTAQLLRNHLQVLRIGAIAHVRFLPQGLD